MPYAPFYLGVEVVFDILINVPLDAPQGVYISEQTLDLALQKYHLTDNYYIINSETILDVNNYIPFSTMNSQAIDVM